MAHENDRSSTGKGDERDSTAACRRCGACCIALSISSLNKPAGARCEYLTDQNLCSLWGKPERPEVCSVYKPDPLFCGASYEEALEIMKELEGK